MSSNAHYTESASAKLRAIVAIIEQELVQAPPTPALQAAWADLVSVLALGPAPETRECPKCGAVGMREASRCSGCWAALATLPKQSATASPGGES